VQLTFRRLSRDTAIYATGMILSRVAAFVMLPLYTRILSTADYGLLQLLDVIVEVAGILVSAGMVAAVTRYYFKAAAPGEQAAVLSTGWAMLIALNVGGMAVLLVASPFIFETVLKGAGSIDLVHIAAVNFVASALPAIPLAVMQIQQRSALFLAATMSRLILQVGLNVFFLLGLEWGPRGVIVSTFISNVALGIPLSIWMLRRTGLRLDWRAARDFQRFGIPLQFAAAAMFILAFGDRFFLQQWRGLSEVGIYSLAYQFGFLLSGVGSTAFLQAWNPQRFQLMVLPRPERDMRYNQGLLFFSLTVVTLMVGISLLARPALMILARPAFWPAADLVPLLVLCYVLQGWTATVHFGIDVSERSKYSSYANWIAAIVILVLYAVLIPRFGAFGAAIATLLGFIVRFAFVYTWAQRLWPVSYAWRPVEKLLGLGLLAVAAGLPLARSTLFVQIGAALALIVLYAVLVWFLILDGQTRGRLRRTLRLGRGPTLATPSHS
jgi:O-antigen/teichoic acid export membrane protein